MKKIIFTLLIIIILFSACSNKNGNSESEAILLEESPKTQIIEEDSEQEMIRDTINYNSIEESLSVLEPTLELLGFSPCNFSNEYSDEYIIFYNDINSRLSYGAPLNIDKVLVIFASDGVIAEKINTKLWSLGYDERQLSAILADSNLYGEWNGYCYLFDKDNDGLDELYFYGLSGMSFDLYIYKYDKNEFQLLEYIDYMGKE